MRSNLANEYLKTLLKYTIALITVMFIKILIIDIMPVNGQEGAPVFSNDKKTKLEYNEEIVEIEKNFPTKGEETGEPQTFKKPIFKDEYLNEYVSDYIEKNSCEKLDFSIYELGNSQANIFLNCDNPKSIVYDYKNKKEKAFRSLTKNYDAFVTNVKRLLNLKYPTFVTEDVLFEESAYDISASEIIGYFDTNEYGLATYIINNNEIRDLMTYEMHYDDAYENEKFVLDPNKKAIAFSFDDGPSTYDLGIIDALVASHSTATFYLVGNRMKNFPDSIKKMIDNKMETGNHTYDHKSLTSLSDAKILEQITKTNSIFYEMTGQNLTSLRPSYGNVNKRVRLQAGLPIVLWSIDTLDWKSRNADKVYAEIMNNVHDGDIVLMHSLYESTLRAVEKVIPELYKQGYQIVSVGELAKLKGKTLTAGSTIWSIK